MPSAFSRFRNPTRKRRHKISWVRSSRSIRGPLLETGSVSCPTATQSTSHNCNISRSVCVYKRCAQGLVLSLSFCVVNIYYLFLCVLSLLFVSRCSAILSIYTEATEIPREGARSFHLCNSLIWTALRRRREGQDYARQSRPALKPVYCLGRCVQCRDGTEKIGTRQSEMIR